MKRAILEGTKLQSPDEVYEALATELDLPAHFGRNLDALRDVLTGEVPGPVEIVWRDGALSHERMGAAFRRLAEVLVDAAAARPDLTVKFE
jgi:ribonuclease inhibitor